MDEKLEEIKKILLKTPNDKIIVYYRDELRLKWKDIAKLCNYSERQCIRIYKKQKEIKK